MTRVRFRCVDIGWLGLISAAMFVGCSDSSSQTMVNPAPPGKADPVMPGAPGGGGPGMGGPMMGGGMMGGGNAGPDNYTGEFPEGRKVFLAQGCNRCHAVGDAAVAGGPPMGGPPGGGPGGPPGAGGPPGGRGGPPGARGPNLAKLGEDPEHTKEWIAEYVKNPKSKKEDSRMPPFDGKISEDDLTHLVDYLASLTSSETDAPAEEAASEQ